MVIFIDYLTPYNSNDRINNKYVLWLIIGDFTPIAYTTWNRADITRKSVIYEYILR